MRSATGTGHAALPVTLRRPALWLAACAALLVGALGVNNEGRSKSTYTDRLLEAAVENWLPEKRHGFWLIESLGDPRSAIVLACLLAVLALLAGRRRLALLAVLGPGLTGVATTLLKPLFDRTLDGQLAYPSGHTAAFTALAISTALLLVSVLRTGAVATALLVGVIAVGAGATMALTLTALEVHYPTDTIGGFSTAVAVVLTTAVVIDLLADARARRRLPT